MRLVTFRSVVDAGRPCHGCNRRAIRP